MLRLEPLVSPVLRTEEMERDRSTSSTRSEPDTPEEPTDDDQTPETVRDLLDREQERSAPEDRSNGDPDEPPTRANRQRSRGVNVRDERPNRRIQSDETSTVAVAPPDSTPHPETDREPLTNPEPFQRAADTTDQPTDLRERVISRQVGENGSDSTSTAESTSRTTTVERRTVTTSDRTRVQPADDSRRERESSHGSFDGDTGQRQPAPPARPESIVPHDIPVRTVETPSMEPLAGPPDPAAPPIPSAVLPEHDLPEASDQSTSHGAERRRVTRQVIERRPNRPPPDRHPSSTQKDQPEAGTADDTPRPDSPAHTVDLDELVDVGRFTDRIARELDKRARIERERRGR